MEYQDNELIDNIYESTEEVRDVLYDKYKYIVDIIINKYKKSAYYLSVDMQELKQEALLGFSDALYSYSDNKGSNLPTFITMCVERRVGNYIRKANTVKMKTMQEMVSLDTEICEDISLIDTIKSEVETPEEAAIDAEEAKELLNKLKGELTKTEMEIYKLLVNNFTYDDICQILGLTKNQLTSAVYRMRRKIKDIY